MRPQGRTCRRNAKKAIKRTILFEGNPPPPIPIFPHSTPVCLKPGRPSISWTRVSTTSHLTHYSGAAITIWISLNFPPRRVKSSFTTQTMPENRGYRWPECKPPVIRMSLPVVNAAASLSKYPTIAFRSSLVPIRCKGVAEVKAEIISGLVTARPLVISVSINPGDTEFTRIPRGPSSTASCWQRDLMAPLEAP